MYKINPEIKKDAKLGLKLHNSGFNGGTTTGFNRAKQLASSQGLDIETIRTMRNWFARHYYTSYPGYKKWVKNGKTLSTSEYCENCDKNHSVKNLYRGAVAWLIWGGDPAYKWIQSKEIQNALTQQYPNKNNTLPKLQT